MRKNGLLLIIPLIFLFAGATSRAGDQRFVNAYNAAADWLALLDAGQYAKTWDKASDSIFKKHISRKKWEKAALSARKPYGTMISRSLILDKYSETLPGLPRGHYMVMQFETGFKEGKGLETVTMAKDKTGKWKLIGYYIK